MIAEKNSKQGYKNTDLGLLPEEWEAAAIGEVSAFSGGSQPPRSTFKFVPTNGYVRLIQIRDYKSDEYETYIPESMMRKSCTEADIMIGRYGPPIFQILRGIAGAYNVALIKATPNNRIDREFYFYVLKQERLFQLIDSLSRRSSGQTGVEMPALKAFGVPLPPLKEQRAIASALSDVDALLAALDRLIAKKRDLKQAAMQQLLTGQTRLPGFRGEWDKKLLGELGSTFGGLVGKSKSDFGAGAGEYVTFLNVISNTIIDATAFERVNVSVFESQNRLKRGDIVFNGSSETPEEVALCALLSVDHDTLFLNSFCFGFRFHDLSDFNGLFLVYYLRSKVGREIMKSLAQGSTRYNLSKPALLKAEVFMPTVQEQNEIATILSDMDAELATLEQRLAKTRALKQGMMQELLTGRIRLVTPQSSPKVAHA